MGLIGVPAGVLRALCADNSCKKRSDAGSAVPFCSLPSALRARIQAGYRDVRSPDILTVTRHDDIAGSTAYPPGNDLAAAWPSIDRRGGTVPLVFNGTGIDPQGVAPAGTTLDDIAATEARIMGLDRPHPEVRSGSDIPSVASGPVPRLVLQVIWAGVGSELLRNSPKAWPYLDHLMRTGAGTLGAETGSAPSDVAAQIATIGTGALPYQHGITGTYIRNDDGKLVRAWGKGAPVSVVAALGDDLDHLGHQKPLIGVVGTDPVDRGAIGGNWYLENDHDDTVYVAPAQIADRTVKVLSEGYGSNSTTDLLSVVESGPVARLDPDLKKMVSAARRASKGSVEVTVAGTGSTVTGNERGPEVVTHQVEKAIKGNENVIQATEPGGLFLDQNVLAGHHITPNQTLSAVKAVHDPGGGPLFHDSFPGIAVSFSRYC